MSPLPVRPPSRATLALALPAALVIWTGTTAYASSAAQGVTTDITAQLEQMFRATDLLTIRESSYEKGFLKSTHRLVVQPIGSEGDPTAGWEIINHIQHGPLAGGTLARAVVDTDIRFLDAQTQADFDQAVGGQKPRIHTVMGLLGHSATDLNFPAGQLHSQEDGSQISWDALSGQVQAGAGGRITGYDLAWPGLQLISADSELPSMELGGMSLSGKQNFSSDQDLIGTGKTTFAMDRLTLENMAEGRTQLLNVQMATDTVLADPEHYDVHVLYDIGTLETPESPVLGGVSMHLGMRHLARQPLQEIAAVYQDIREQALQASDSSVEFTPQQEQEMQDVYSRNILKVLQSEPVLTLDQAGWTGMQVTGQTTLSGLAEAIGSTGSAGLPQLEQVLPMIPSHLQANLKFQITPEAVGTLNQLSGTEMSAEELLYSGSFRQEGEHLIMDLAYTDGQMTINGESVSDF